MRILVCSDSHGRDDYLLKAVSREKPFDALIHLGDIEGSEDKVRALCSGPTWMVAGNCDYYTDLPDDRVVEAAGHRLFLTHGNHFRVNGGNYLALASAARQNGCDIALFGHVHYPVETQECGVIVLNPGSISLPRQENRRPSYLILQLEEGRRSKTTFKYL